MLFRREEERAAFSDCLNIASIICLHDIKNPQEEGLGSDRLPFL
jgi:hypothetical protein